MRPTPLLRAALLAAALAAAPGAVPAAAQDAPEPGTGLGEEPPKPLTPDEERAARKLFEEAKALVERGQGIPARRLFEDLLDRYPGADEEMLREADDRSGDNFLAGIVLQHDAGPPSRRIDIELMGDGYTLERFRNFAPDALSQMKEFWAEPLYAEYEDYFNVWRFDLVSKEDGVDEMTPEERGMPPPKEDEAKRKRRRRRKEPKQYSTALDCKAAGPQNQVWANPEQVLRWRRYFRDSDGLTIAFAKKGQLGMGGGGIATTGKKVAVVHEFGHAFVLLLDEYTVNPDRPMGRIWAPNAVSTDDPDPRKLPSWKDVPWAHWYRPDGRPLVEGVGIFLGGATHMIGAFRPAASCAMNSGGSDRMCWVCREQGVLRIYSYLGPVDESGPASDTVRLGPGESREFFVQPMQPKTHAVKVDWTLQVLATGGAAPPPADPAPPEETSSVVPLEEGPGFGAREGDRAAARRSNPLPEGAPRGAPWKATAKRAAGGAWRSVVKLEKLPPGTYRLTARVLDDTRVPGYPQPWVIRDPDRLREEWRAWTVEVPAPAAPAPAAPPK